MTSTLAPSDTSSSSTFIPMKKNASKSETAITIRMYKERKIKCKGCNYIFTSIYDFNDHKRTHIPPHKLLSCKFCNYVTMQEGHLATHQRIHQNQKPFRCNVCDYTCVSNSMLNKHLETHRNVYRYKCKNCSFKAKLEYSLRQHLSHCRRIQTPADEDKKSYKCDVCGYTCRFKSQLNQHSNAHSNIYQYRCKDCSFKAKHQKSLERHLLQEQHEADFVLEPNGTVNLVLDSIREGWVVRAQQPLSFGKNTQVSP